ncbi:MAG TPA: VOC family protein [Caulobacteraceae bacterium]|jgi:catechol 2,3-dioxygenase-like lactoylglutathione lyase family enzyme
MLSGRNLVQAALPVTDLARARAFYADTLGLPLLFETNGMAFFQLGNLRLMLGRPEEQEGGTETKHGACLYFDAPDLPDLADRLETAGVRFLGPAETVQRSEAGDLQLRFFRDPDGNLLALMGMVARRP